MRLLFVLAVLAVFLGVALQAEAKNYYQNSSFELGLSPVLSSGENHLSQGESKFGDRHAVSCLDIHTFAVVPVPTGATTVTFSIFIRGESRAQLRLGIRGNAFRTWAFGDSFITPGTSWLRHHVTFELDPTVVRNPENERVFVAPFIQNPKGIDLHLDGAQVEFGDLTDYAPSTEIVTRTWTERYGNVFKDDAPVLVSAGIENNLGAAIKGQWTTTVTNHRSAVVHDTNEGMEVAPGSSTRKILDLGNLPLGHYTVESKVVAGQGKIASGHMTFCVIAAKDEKRSEHFGLHSRYVNIPDPQISKARWDILDNVGAGWVRIFCNWAFVEQEKDKFDWQYYDSEIDAARQRGMKVLGVFYNRAPKWAGGGTEKDGVGKLDLGAFLPERLRFQDKFISRYAKKIDAWEIFNEPYWFYSADLKRGLAKKFLQDYVHIHGKTCELVKKYDPEATIVGNLGDFFARENDFSFFQRVAAGGALQCMHALSLHDYEYRMPSEKLSANYTNSLGIIRKLMAVHGKEKMPLWMTEGALTNDDYLSLDNVFYERLQHFMKQHLGEVEAAKHYVKAVMHRWRGGAEKDFYFNFSQPGEMEPLLATFRNRWEEPKVIYPAQCALVRLLGGAVYSSSALWKSGALEAYIFEGDDEIIAAYWSDKFSGALLVDTDGLGCLALAARDFMGNTAPLSASSQTTLAFDDEPRFLQCKTAQTTQRAALFLERLQTAQVVN